MADFMKVDMSRLGQAEGRSADSGMAAPSGADVDTFQQAMRRRPLDERQGSGGDESDGGHEIRLTLGKDVLPGTEIRLQRGSDGVLSVHLATDNAASFQTLVGAQESLKARLESFEKDVRVEVVSERGEAEAEIGDGRRQSRGEYVAPDERDA